MSLRSRLHRLSLRWFGSRRDGWPDPPVNRFRAQLDEARRAGVAVDDDWLVEWAAAAWQLGFETGWTHEEVEYWREHAELPPQGRIDEQDRPRVT